jgi:probable DNA metabolism protein
MRFLVYDDSFEGLLTAIGFARDHDLAQIEILPEKKAAGLLFRGDFIATDPEKADSLLRVFRHIAGPKALKPVFLTYLADDAPREKILLNFIRLTLHEGRNVNGWLHHDAVAELMAAARRVSHEIHRLTGFLRFQELADGSLYAPFEPDHHVIMPLARHFSRRLPDRNWMLHDLRRQEGTFSLPKFLPAKIISLYQDGKSFFNPAGAATIVKFPSKRKEIRNCKSNSCPCAIGNI